MGTITSNVFQVIDADITGNEETSFNQWQASIILAQMTLQPQRFPLLLMWKTCTWAPSIPSIGRFVIGIMGTNENGGEFFTIR